MFTASHNPAGDNGIKLCRAGAAGISADTGLTAVRDRVADGGQSAAGTRRGGLASWDVLPEYADHLRTLAPVEGRSLEVVVDAGNGMAGLTVPAALADSALTVVPLYFALDGSFPNHQANPLDPKNLEDLQDAVVRHGADLGLAFDGDADRCFAVDEGGTPVSPSAVTALIAVRLLTREPGARIIHNAITSRAVPETVRRHGGVPVRTKVGHSLIKAAMAEHDAAFGGEHSGHYYFREFWYADSGMLAARHLLGALAESDRPLSRLVADYEPYHSSGEHNLAVDDPAQVLERIASEYADDGGMEVDRLDGVTVSGPGWWFNVRASNTEPLLRLNVEGDTRATMMQIRDDVLSLVRS
jgi:phosphomannomutase